MNKFRPGLINSPWPGRTPFGGAMKTSTIAGRVAVYVPYHPSANNRGYVLRSRYVVEQSLGRYLRSDEHVHHQNGDETDDRLENLLVVSPQEHIQIHKPSESRRRRLDYQRIEQLMAAGYGYRRIAKLLGEPVYSVKRAVKVLRERDL